MAIIVPADAAISAIPLLRSSAMRRSVEIRFKAVNMHIVENFRNRTNNRPVSGKAAKASRTMDARIQNTRETLGDALVELMHEKPFEEITVQQVLDRATIARSTFYTHYRDKNDLFLSDVEDFFEMMATMIRHCGEVSNRVAPVRELFAHVGEVPEFRAALAAAGKLHDVLELGQGYFARGIEQRLIELTRAAENSSVNLTAMSHAFAGALFSLISWWLDRGMPASPAEMDEIFHRMVWSAINS